MPPMPENTNAAWQPRVATAFSSAPRKSMSGETRNERASLAAQAYPNALATVVRLSAPSSSRDSRRIADEEKVQPPGGG